MCHKRYYQLVLSLQQALVMTYVHAVVPAVMREVAPKAQYEIGMEVLLQCLEAAGQPVPPTVSFLQDNLAVMVMEGLLNLIKLMQKQHVSVLEQIDRATKHKLLSPEETIGEPKQARQQLLWQTDTVRAGVLTTSQLVPQVAPPLNRPVQSTAPSMGSVLLVVMLVQPTAASTGQATLLPMPAQPVATSAGQSTVAILAPVALMVPKALGVQRAMDEEMMLVEARGAVPPLKGTAGLPRHGPPAMSQALDAPGPSKTHQGQKLLLAASQLEIVDFSANIPERAEAAQMLFMKAMVFPAPPELVVVVVVSTDLHTPVQYDGIVATMAAKKGKHCEAPSVNDDSDYGELQSEEEEEDKEDKTPTQRFQHIQQNKKIAKKKVNKAKAAAALAHKVQNNFSSCILNGLGVKIWRLLDVERLNSCFCGAISPCCYYLYQTNTVFVGTEANQAATFEFSSGQQAKIPGMMVYKFAHCGFPSMPFELEWLQKYYVNPHIPCCDLIIMYMLFTKLQGVRTEV
ncbi:hypothetical protein C0993_012718 [Termitomyces sp. T159_Od127]|nr:hypothetical protein C0993_012718 [Termitomyces sp. T159_Od127]